MVGGERGKRSLELCVQGLSERFEFTKHKVLLFTLSHTPTNVRSSVFFFTRRISRGDWGVKHFLLLSDVVVRDCRRESNVLVSAMEKLKRVENQRSVYLE